MNLLVCTKGAVHVILSCSSTTLYICQSCPYGSSQPNGGMCRVRAWSISSLDIRANILNYFIGRFFLFSDEDHFETVFTAGAAAVWYQSASFFFLFFLLGGRLTSSRPVCVCEHVCVRLHTSV